MHVCSIKRMTLLYPFAFLGMVFPGKEREMVFIILTSPSSAESLSIIIITGSGGGR